MITAVAITIVMIQRLKLTTFPRSNSCCFPHHCHCPPNCWPCCRHRSFSIHSRTCRRLLLSNPPRHLSARNPCTIRGLPLQIACPLNRSSFPNQRWFHCLQQGHRTTLGPPTSHRS